MPTYQYACTACGEHLEVVQRFSDEPLTVCPACQGMLRKVFSPVGVVFKGSGFYRTDSRKPAETSAGGAAKSEGGSTGQSGSTGTSTPSTGTGPSGSSGSSTSSDKVA